MSVTRNRAIALRFAREGWGTEQNWERVWDDVMAADVVHHFNSEPNAIVGLEANKAFNAGLFQGFPDIQQTIEDVIAEDDKVAYRATLRGCHTGKFFGIPPTGKSAHLNGFTLLRFDGERIAEWWYEANLLELMKQLGLMPT